MSLVIDSLLKKIHDHTFKIGVIGLGYVGLPLAYGFFKKGFHVVGFDTDHHKIKSLRDKKSYIKVFDHNAIADMMEGGQFYPTDQFERLRDVDVIIICVPTPLTKNREPDMTYVSGTADVIAQYLMPHQLIILESTTYPGTTSELIATKLSVNGKKQGKDFFLAYSPEREDPGNPTHSTTTIPKVVGADDVGSLKLAEALYGYLVPSVITVSSAATAEAVKLTENIFRCVNIALVNELKIVYDKMGIDVWEVIHAAKTKPFGFMPFYPGPGLGGHCIPIDPFYLTWKAREFDVGTKFIELAGEVNTAMPTYVIERLRHALDQRLGKGLKGSKILILGLAYKKNVDDPRESPSLLIFERLLSHGASVDYHDPYIPVISDNRHHPSLAGLSSIALESTKIKGYDAVLVCTDHDSVDYGLIAEHASLIVDTRNVMSTFDHLGEKVVKA